MELPLPWAPDLGELWLAGGDRVGFRGGWCEGAPELERFVSASGGFELERGKGIAGHVWEHARARWSPELREEQRFSRRSYPRGELLRSALATDPEPGHSVVNDPAEICGLEFSPTPVRVKFSFNLVATSIASPLTVAGTKRHCLTAAIAASSKPTLGRLHATTLASPTEPSLSTFISIRTLPFTPAW